MKKFLTIALALLLVCTLSLPAFAAGTGTITIKGLVDGADYEIYQLLDLQTYDAVNNNYYYTVNAEWAGFFATPEALAYVEIVDGSYVEWTAAEDDATKAAFAQLALEYAQNNGIAPVKSSKNTGEMDIVPDGEKTNGVFSNLDLGYYLVDSTIGVLCNLTTTDPSVEITPKSTIPTVDKEVGGSGSWGSSSSAQVGDIIDYQVTITVGAGAENYVLHDKMSAGLTFEQDLANSRGVLGITLNGAPMILDTDYTIKTTGITDGCTFEVVFTAAGMAKMKTGDTVIVSYNAMLNVDAVVSGAGTDNEAHLEYGDEMTSTSTSDTTETYTYSIDLIKTDGDHKLIDGAQFKLYDAATGGNEIPVVKVSDGVYRLALTGETGEAIVVKDGKVTIKGFDNGTYYLEETKVPDGYNMLTARKEFTITDADLTAEFVGDVYTPGTGVQVVNKTGNALPETGGIGTVIFVVVGALAVLGTGVLLVTKKRMSMIED